MVVAIVALVKYSYSHEHASGPRRGTGRMSTWADCAHFFREFRRDFHHTGALLPSGRFLAEALARPLRGQRGPARILEVGPGTGSVTRVICRNMRPGDRLDAVEINPFFAARLRERVARDTVLSFCPGDIRV